MAAPTTGPCSAWITDDDLDPGTCCADGPTLTRAATISSNILYRLSGRQYPGLCTQTVRPCGAGCASWARWPAYRDHWWHAEQVAQGSGGWELDRRWRPTATVCGGHCHLPSVVLPGPIADVSEVIVDGVVLDPSAYRARAHRWLERLDGGTWPCTQSLALDSSEGGATGTWQVTYLYGRVPGEDGLSAAREYACEIAKALCPASTGDCRLPERTKSVVRSGISFEISAPIDLILDKGRTGLPAVDLWLTSVNPARLQRRATVSRLD